MFLTITRANLKAGNEAAAKELLSKNFNPSDGKKPSEVVEGLIGFGVMKAKADPNMYGICTVWQSEEAFDKMSSNSAAKSGGAFVEKLKALCDGSVSGEGFYIEGI